MQLFKRNIPVLLVIILFSVLLLPLAARAAANDNFSDAAIISSLPFSGDANNNDATVEENEPLSSIYLENTVWYSFTPTESGVVRIDLANINYTGVNVYKSTGTGFNGLVPVAYAYYWNITTFAVQAGITYYLQAGSMNSYSPGNIHLNLQAVPPPDNDNFNRAKPIAGLPFNDYVDITGATLQAGEPSPSCTGGAQGTVWYAFTPTTNGSVSAAVSNSFGPVLAVYAGNSLTELTQLGCQTWGILTFQVNAGVTYYLQVGRLNDAGGQTQLSMNVTPPPVANFYFNPSDPSIYDVIQFNDNSYDPGQSSFEPAEWDFGDGQTASGCCPLHQYANDNDYTAKLTVTTLDGRTASASQVVHVRTRDIAISKFSVPQSGRAGQTRQLTVGVSSKLYPENVQVQLLKSVQGSSGFETVGTLTQLVPVRSANRTINFSFSYTFTPADAAIGKVTFKAVAIIAGYRDVLPADNEVVALPTKVAP